MSRYFQDFPNEDMIKGACLINSWQVFLKPASQVALVVKNLPATAGVVRDTGLIPGSGRTPGGGHGNPLQCSCLENPMDRRSWWLQSMGLQRVGHNLSDLTHIAGNLYSDFPDCFKMTFLVGVLESGS